MTKGLKNAWEIEAGKMRRRDLTKEETAAIGEEMLKGMLVPDMDQRRRKSVIRTAIDSVRPGRKVQAGR
ncbi:hypothetical protein [Aureimonas sp. SK2]|uniref:hypothetical protein n=1 Tax=Aureimonas sp. SK2 TaxID=3015992 RepID=UPI00244420F3|nr:hypothetical protein [Aureimonas sp. SK2]